MSEFPNTPGSSRPNDLAVALTASALLVFLVWQSIMVLRNQSAIKSQAEQRAQLAVQQAEQRAKLVSQSKAVQGDLQKLANDLFELSRTDPEAKTLVDRYGIKVTPPAAKQ